MESLASSIRILEVAPSKGTPVSQRGDTVRIPNTNIRVGIAYTVTERQISEFTRALLRHRALAFLEKSRYFVLGIEPQGTQDEKGMPVAPRFYCFTLFDYSKNRALRITADFPKARQVEIVDLDHQPVPSYEEWQAAVQILSEHPKYGAALRSGEAQVFDPYPHREDDMLTSPGNPRFVPIGVHYSPPRTGYTVFDVDIATRTVNEGFSPAEPCGVSAASCSTTPRGTAGSAWVEWPAGNPVWRMYITRPAASSGNWGSGIEIQTASYRGKSVLKRAHMPILNVQYDGNACGPYRDWMYTEHCFHASGTDLAPGIRWCSTPPQTICEAREDSGSFKGVAVYEAGDELVMITECSAGWYRYINEWRFHRDGLIRPRFIYGTTNSSCSCYGRWHHGYWRLDFDLNGSGSHVVEELSTPYPNPHPRWNLLRVEAKRFRRYGRRTRWRVRNTATGETAEIIPHPMDGMADAYGKGDFWALRYKQNSQGNTIEIDDQGAPGWSTSATLDAFVNNEVIADQDIVIWYATHFRRTGGDPLGWCTAIGPDIVLLNW